MSLFLIWLSGFFFGLGVAGYVGKKAQQEAKR
jgi:hypothetical protein